MAWLWRIKRRHSILKIIPQEGTGSVGHVYTWKRYEKASECLSGLTEVFLSQSSSVKTGEGDCFFQCEDKNAGVQGMLIIEET